MTEEKKNGEVKAGADTGVGDGCEGPACPHGVVLDKRALFGLVKLFGNEELFSKEWGFDGLAPGPLLMLGAMASGYSHSEFSKCVSAIAALGYIVVNAEGVTKGPQWSRLNEVVKSGLSEHDTLSMLFPVASQSVN